MARQIAAALKAELSPRDRKRLERTEEINSEAYEFYLRARHERTARETEENLRKASEYFELALAKQPNFARAWAGLAEVWFLMVGHHLLPREALEPKVREAVERALAIDDALPEGHVSQGVVRLFWDLDVSGAEQSYKRALELNPNHWNARREYGLLLMRSGRLDEALVQLRQVQGTDPVNDIANRQLAELYLYRRQYDQAVLHFARMSRPPVFQLAVAYTGKGKGLDEIRSVLEPWQSIPNYPVALAYASPQRTMKRRRSGFSKSIRRSLPTRFDSSPTFAWRPCMPGWAGTTRLSTACAKPTGQASGTSSD